jgi:O-antigen ligase
MSRITKLVVIISSLVALWLLARLVSRAIPPILVPSVVAFVAAWASAALVGDVIATLILALVYVVPALCMAWFNNFSFSYYAIWLAALCGSMLPRSAVSEWALPRPFNFPVVLWALVLALSWPIVLLREVDFLPGLPGLDPESFANARVPRSPAIIAVWTLSVTSIATIGLLLLDWIFLAYPVKGSRGRNETTHFERRVVWPLLAGAASAGAVGAYQSLVDMSFPFPSFFGSLGRAVGTMRDANPFGAVMAGWVPVAVALAITAPRAGDPTGGHRERRWQMPLGLVLLTVFGIAVWGSGSRTALLAALAGVCFLIAYIWRSLNARHVVIGIATLAILVAAFALIAPSSTPGPWQRLLDLVPSRSKETLQSTAYQLWSRDMYGDAAMRMIAEHPFVGVGVGGFQYQYSDALKLMFDSKRPPDNAQNWYRQQLAELGLFGSVGWIVWMGMFLWVLVRRHGPPERRVMVGAVKGALIGLAVASLLGVPTQDAAASVTFIVLAGWCLKLTDVENTTDQTVRARLSKVEWAAILSILMCFLGGTAYAGWTELRPPLRALRVDVPYRYGFTPDENDPEFRWTGAKAVEVLAREKRWLRLVIGAVAPDAGKNPVQVKVWIDRRLILRVNRHGNFPIVRWIRMPDDKQHVMIEIAASRTWRPSDFGLHGAERIRGVAVGSWVFSDEDPPRGSVTFE